MVLGDIWGGLLERLGREVVPGAVGFGTRVCDKKIFDYLHYLGVGYFYV